MLFALLGFFCAFRTQFVYAQFAAAMMHDAIMYAVVRSVCPDGKLHIFQLHGLSRLVQSLNDGWKSTRHSSSVSSG